MTIFLPYLLLSMLSSFTFHDLPSKGGKSSKKKTKDDEPSIQSMTNLVSLLSIQVEKLGHMTVGKQRPTNQEISNQVAAMAVDPIIVDPFDLEVPQSYEELLLREPILSAQVTQEQQQQQCCCCKRSSSTSQSHGVSAAPGIPWPRPQRKSEEEDPLQMAYTHWCTLMRCLPMMEPTSQAYVQTIGQFAMRQLLQKMQARCPSTTMLTTVSQKSLKYALTSSKDLTMFLSCADSSSNSGRSSSLLASASFFKSPSSCLNVHNYAADTTSRKKADAWIPQYATLFPLPPSPPQQPRHTAAATTTSPVLQLPSSLSSLSSSQASRKFTRWFKRHNRVSPQPI